MRDPDRIFPLMTKLAGIWSKTPDLRFGQLIENIIGDGKLIWYLEDDNFETLLDKWDKRNGETKT